MLMVCNSQLCRADAGLAQIRLGTSSTPQILGNPCSSFHVIHVKYRSIRPTPTTEVTMLLFSPYFIPVTLLLNP